MKMNVVGYNLICPTAISDSWGWEPHTTDRYERQEGTNAIEKCQGTYYRYVEERTSSGVPC